MERTKNTDKGNLTNGMKLYPNQPERRRTTNDHDHDERRLMDNGENAATIYSIQNIVDSVRVR